VDRTAPGGVRGLTAAMVGVILSVLTQLGLFALVTLSLALVFGASRVVNLAVGDLAAVGAYAMVATAGLPFAVGVAVGLVTAAPVLFLMERGLLRWLRGDPLASLLVTWGIGMAVRQVCEVVFGATPRSVPAPVSADLEVLGAPYPAYRVVAAAVGIAVVGAALLVCYWTRVGLRLRAVSDNAEMADLLGTPPARTRSAAFVVAGLLSVLAGALYSPLLGVNPTMGFALLIPAFFALLLARPGAFAGAVAAVAVIVTLQVALRRLFSDTAAEALFYVVVLVAVALRSTAPLRRFRSWITRPVPAAGGTA
jgi:branched-subunit amino acid ABC-type transport system permease component